MAKRILKYFIIWLILSVIYFLLAEPLVKLLFPDEHNVVLWYITLVYGLLLIVIMILTSFLIETFVKRDRQKTS
ncbi:MAG: hypothetical protein K0S32_4336 [Bacteroidetes bacterium]|jgi:Na+-driven multidrug efflux pump|nr:hypothetical protein [Bacteroidota bacterium]